MVPRARIELATPAFSGPRSTSELPRHRYSVQFYGNCAALTNENHDLLVSLHRIVVFLHPAARLQDFASLGAVGRAHYAILLH
jgi:hypothetical protein